jgi:hypothetical protein
LCLRNLTVHERASRHGRHTVDDECALELTTETVAGRVLAGVDRIRGADDEPRTGRDDDAIAALLAVVGFGRCDAVAEKHADNLVLRECLDAAAGVEHDDAVAAADEIAFE